LLLLPTNERLSLGGFLAEAKVAEQRPEGRELALDADPRREDVDGVADPHRSVGTGHGALSTTAARQGCLESQDIVDPEHLADVRARRSLAVHTERHRADPELRARWERGHAGKTLDRDLLAQVAGLQTERLVGRTVDDHDSAPLAMCVRVALDASTDTADDLVDRARVLAVALVQVQTDDAGVHHVQRTVTGELWTRQTDEFRQRGSSIWRR